MYKEAIESIATPTIMKEEWDLNRYKWMKTISGQGNLEF